MSNSGDLAFVIVSMLSSAVVLFITTAYIVFAIVGAWKMFEKAGEPGWTAIVPILNFYKLCKISLGNGWFFLLCLVPIAQLILFILVAVKLSKAFGHGILFAIGLMFFTPIFYMILGFGNATYRGINGQI